MLSLNRDSRLPQPEPLHPVSISEQSVMGHGGRSLQTMVKSLSEYKPGLASHSLLADQVVTLSYFSCATLPVTAETVSKP